MKTLTSILLYIVLAFGAFAQDKKPSVDWELKPVAEWNGKDIDNILQNSPWSRKLEDVTVQDFSILMVAIPTTAMFTLQSALPVRLAVIRKRQLDEKYDLMSEKDKAVFNTKYRAYLECERCEKYYIVAITAFSQTFQNAGSIQRRSSSIYLANEKGEKRTLAKYSPSTHDSPAFFFFPRNNEKNEPLLTAENITLTFNFRYEQGDELVIRLIQRVEIKVRDIVRDKVVVF